MCVFNSPGLKYAQTAYEMDPKVYNHVKWVAALTGSRVDYLGTKEKIEQGKLFKVIGFLSLHKWVKIRFNKFPVLNMNISKFFDFFYF